MNIVNLLPIEANEKVTAMIPVKEFDKDKYLVFVTKFGTVKRMDLSDLYTARKAGFRALTLSEDDELIGVRLTEGDAKIIIATHDGKAIRFDEKEIDRWAGWLRASGELSSSAMITSLA